MTDKIKLKADKFVNDKKLKLNYIKPKDLKILLAEFCEEQIAELKAECDLAIEGRDIKIMELEEDYKTLSTSYNILKDNDEKIIKEMIEQLEKMKWHYLVKDPKDLPKEEGLYWACVRDGRYKEDGSWEWTSKPLCMTAVWRDGVFGKAGCPPVIAWCELPEWEIKE